MPPGRAEEGGGERVCVCVVVVVIYLFIAPGGCSWQTWEGVGAIARRIIARGGEGGEERGDPEAPEEAETGRSFPPALASAAGGCARTERGSAPFRRSAGSPTLSPPPPPPHPAACIPLRGDRPLPPPTLPCYCCSCAWAGRRRAGAGRGAAPGGRPGCPPTPPRRSPSWA